MTDFLRHFVSYLLKYKYIVKTYWTTFVQNIKIFNMISRKMCWLIKLRAERGQQFLFNNSFKVNILLYITEAKMFISTIYNYILQYPHRYSLQFYRVLSCVYPIVSCVYPIVSCVYPIVSYRIVFSVYQVLRFLSCFPFIVFCVYRVDRLSGSIVYRVLRLSCIFGNPRFLSLLCEETTELFRVSFSFCK